MADEPGEMPSAVVRESSPAYEDSAMRELAESTYLPSRLRTRARQFALSMGLLGANDDELTHIDATLHSDHVSMLVQRRPDGSVRTTDEMDAEFETHINAMRRWLRLRMESRGAKLLDEEGGTSQASGLPRSPKSATNRKPPGADDKGTDRKRA